MDQEHGLLNQQVQSLSEDLARHNTEMTNTRREYTNNLVTLRTQLAEKTEEVFVYISINKLHSKLSTIRGQITSFAAYPQLPNISRLHTINTKKRKRLQILCRLLNTTHVHRQCWNTNFLETVNNNGSHS